MVPTCSEWPEEILSGKLQRPDKNDWFAEEATSGGSWYGTVNGACESGVDAADVMLKVISGRTDNAAASGQHQQRRFGYIHSDDYKNWILKVERSLCLSRPRIERSLFLRWISCSWRADSV